MSIFTTISLWTAYLALVFLGWITILAVVMLTSDAAPGAVAFFPTDDFIANLPDDAGVVSSGRYWIGIRSDQPSLGFDLYRAGAVLVLPAGLPGCLPLAS